MGYVKPRHLGLAALAAVLTLSVFPQYRDRLLSLTTLVSAMSETQDAHERPDSAIRGRFTEMLAAARVFADHPLIGVGPGMFKFYAEEYGNEGGLKMLEGPRQAHNLYLGIAADMGAPGLVCFLGMVFVTIRSLGQARKRFMKADPMMADMAAGFLLTIVTFLATGMSSNFSFTRYFWLMLGLATAAASMPARAPCHQPGARARQNSIFTSNPEQAQPSDDMNSLASYLQPIRRRMSVRLLIDRDPDHRKSVFLAGTGRSGGGWIAETINQRNDYRYIFEPFHPKRVPWVKPFPARKYMRPDEDDPEFFALARKIVTGRIRHPWTERFNQALHRSSAPDQGGLREPHDEVAARQV